MAYDYKNDPNNPDAKPLYNDNILKFWNWFDTVWSCTDWMTWHKSLRSKYGLSIANQKFIAEWDNLATGSSAIDCRTFNTSFRDYMKKVGLLDALYYGIGYIAKPIGAAGDIITSAGNVVSDIGKGAEKTIRTASVLLPIILIIAVVFAIIYFGKKYNVAK